MPNDSMPRCGASRPPTIFSTMERDSAGTRIAMTLSSCGTSPGRRRSESRAAMVISRGTRDIMDQKASPAATSKVRVRISSLATMKVSARVSRQRRRTRWRQRAKVWRRRNLHAGRALPCQRAAGSACAAFPESERRVSRGTRRLHLGAMANSPLRMCAMRGFPAAA